MPKPVCSGTEALGSLESLQRLSHVSVAEEHLNFLCQPMLGHDLVVFPGVLPCQNVHSSGILSGPAQKGPWFFQQDLVECRALLKAILVLAATCPQSLFCPGPQEIAKLKESPGVWKAGAALLWDVWDLGARAREVSGVILKGRTNGSDRSSQNVLCNILGKKIQRNENYFLVALQTILDDVIGSSEHSLQIISECLKTINFFLLFNLLEKYWKV